jgi:predicted ATPase
MANRLVTLTGPGGIGKTRLAIELGRQLLPQFDGGVWVVELGPSSDPGLVLRAIASALKLDGADTPERVAASLGSRNQLLVLDNCEHVIDAAAGVAEALLQMNPSLRVIATNQEPL